jgi:hypothetical protein
VSDVSRSGCYVETEKTLAVGDAAQLRLSLAGISLDISGRVASATPMVGMGLDFVDVSTEQKEKIAQIIEEVARVKGSPCVQQDVRPRSPTMRITRDAAPEILADIIRRINEKGVLTRQELVEIVKANQ